MSFREKTTPIIAAEKEEMRRLFAAGYDKPHIAEQVGRSYSAVCACVRRLRPAAPSVAKKTRPCLCCQKTLESEGAHHRLCPCCRKKTTTPFDL